MYAFVLLVGQVGVSLVSCVFANDEKEYLVVGTAYVLEEVRTRMPYAHCGL